MSRCYIPGTFTSGHLGIDIATKGASLEVIAADGGEVVWTIAAGDPNLPTYGNALTIKHKDGLFTTYNHAAKLLVKTGDKVTKGQKIAESGNTGNSFGAHLHFEVSKQSAPYYPDTTNTMDPLNYMKIPAGIPFSPGTSCRR
jgi:murein DD-endopeptidase MepM/ murein hydrolase activator NlpD